LNTLPERPSLEYLKAQAKELLTALRSGQESARFAATFPDRMPGDAKLADAQHVIAREYGFESWPRLKAHVEQARLGFSQLCRSFIENARDGDVSRAEQILRDNPDVASAGIAEAAFAGNVAYLRSHVDSSNVAAPTKASGWPVLACVCSSTLMRSRTRRPAFVEAVQLLLGLGADQNTRVIVDAYPDSPLSALYWAGGYNNAPEVAEPLLEAGATPDDGECLYHSADHRDHEFLRLLLRYKVKPENTNALKRMLDFEDPVGLALLLDVGIDPNEYRSDPAIHHGLRRGRSPAMIGQLIDGGADPSLADKHGVTPYNLAVSLGLEEQAAVIAAKGGSQALSESAATLRKAHRGERLDPGAVARLHGEMPDIMHLFAEQGLAKPIKALLEAGHPADSLGLMYNCTPLHMACHEGYVECVAALLEAGSSVDVKDTMYDGWPLGWAMHGALFSHSDPDGSKYRRIVEMLIAKGTPIYDPPEGRADLEALLRGCRPRGRSNGRNTGRDQ
jgi:ankyrin repeat protein